MERNIDREYEQYQLGMAIDEVMELREENRYLALSYEEADKEIHLLLNENKSLKEKIDFYEGELHRRGYVIRKEL